MQEAKSKLVSPAEERWGVNHFWNKCKRQIPVGLGEQAHRKNNRTRGTTQCFGRDKYWKKIPTLSLIHLNPTEGANLFLFANPENRGGGLWGTQKYSPCVRHQ